jgi:cysteine synthase A|tara:strand:- start:384 stop:1382 length:999 start_codon:yes stop_codon:yes gene_type:complete
MNKEFINLIGNTNLVRLNIASEETGCEIFGKAEFQNPGGSVKDRAAWYIIKEAIEEGKLLPGGTIVEGTAGNTGIGIALTANSLGYKSTIVVPETQSKEKLQLIAACGAHLITVPAVPYKDENNYIKFSGRLAQELNDKNSKGAIWANQFDNQANRKAHYETTGPEIWEQTEGSIDAFVSAVGTGGTIAGVSRFLKEQNPNIKICLADPPGAALFNYYVNGELKAEGSSITEGIGQGRITNNLEGTEIDKAYLIPDQETIDTMFSLTKKEGLFLGSSSGINVAAAIRLGKELGPGHCIVTILCDPGTRYLSKLYNADFLKSKKLLPPEWLKK